MITHADLLMDVLYILIPLAAVLVTAAVFAFGWACKNGQLDDLDTPPLRILFDDELKRQNQEHPEVNR